MFQVPRRPAVPFDGDNVFFDANRYSSLDRPPQAWRSVARGSTEVSPQSYEARIRDEAVVTKHPVR